MTFKNFFELAKSTPVNRIGYTKEYTWRGYSLHIYNTKRQVNIIDDDDLAEVAIVDAGDEYHIYRSTRRGYINYDSYESYSADDNIYDVFNSVCEKKYIEAVSIVNDEVA